MKRVFCAVLAAALLFMGCGLTFAQQPVRICADNSEGTACATMVQPRIPSAAAEGSHVFKTTAGNLIDFSVNNLSTTGGLTVFLFDSATVPGNGAVTSCATAPSVPGTCLLKVYGLPAAPSSTQTGTIVVNWQPGPWLHFYSGIVAACSSTAPPTLTISANCWFAGDVQ